jgi:ATP-binding cassette subfamily C protein PrsD
MLALFGGALQAGAYGEVIVATTIMLGLYGLSAVVDMARQKNVTHCALRIERGATRLARRAGPGAAKELGVFRTLARGPVPAALCDLPLVPLYLAVLHLCHPALGLLAAGGAGSIIGCIALMDRSAGRLKSSRRRPIRYDASLQRPALSACALRALRPALQSTMIGLGAYLVATGACHPASVLAAAILLPRVLGPLETITASRKPIGQAYERAMRLATNRSPANRVGEARCGSPQHQSSTPVLQVVLRTSPYARKATGVDERSMSSDLRPTAQ